jgi:hypothetical protein
VPPFRAAQIVGARFAFFVSLAHLKDHLKKGDGGFESGLRNRRQIAQSLGKHLTANEVFWLAQRRTLMTFEGRLVLRMDPQNACIALPERYIQSGESGPHLGPPAYP